MAEAVVGRLLMFGLPEARAINLSTELDADRVVRNLDHVEHEVARSKKGRGAVENAATSSVAAAHGDYAASAGTPSAV